MTDPAANQPPPEDAAAEHRRRGPDHAGDTGMIPIDPVREAKLRDLGGRDPRRRESRRKTGQEPDSGQEPGSSGDESETSGEEPERGTPSGTGRPPVEPPD